MSDEERSLLDAARAHRDLGESPEATRAAWEAASDEQKRKLLDRLLVDALLLDTLGRRRARPARRAFPWRRALAAAAAVLVAAGAALLLWGRGPAYPEPRGSGDFEILSATGQRLARDASLRGQRLVAGPGGATLSLGGYCELALDPGTVAAVRGQPGKEAIELQEGKVVSRIVPAKGAFRITTPGGFLDVVGTEFETTVRYPLSQGETAVKSLRKSAIVTVAVVTGLVAYHFGGLDGVLGGGASKVFAAEAKTIVAGKPTYKPKGDNPNWKEKGRIVGLVRQCPGCKVEALNADGTEVVTSATVEAGGKTYELQWLAPGTYQVRVSADGYGTLVVKDLVVKAKNDLAMNIEFEN